MTQLKSKGYCGNCGDWATDCKTIVVYGTPEKVCADCRENNDPR